LEKGVPYSDSDSAFFSQDRVVVSVVVRLPDLPAMRCDSKVCGGFPAVDGKGRLFGDQLGERPPFIVWYQTSGIELSKSAG
jgi:hypothetical protein